MKTKSGGGSKSLVRLLAAIEGFYVKHGHWPIRVRVFPGFIGSIKNDILSETQYLALISKIELVPDEEAPVVAEDNEGNSYSYGIEGFSKSKPGRGLSGWISIQPRSIVVGPMTIDAAFARLNPAQREAATHGEAQAGGVRASALLVIAGPGTGKTNTLAHRVAYFLLHGVPPERLLLLTFTRRAALEMTRRAQRVVGESMAAAKPGATLPSTLRMPWSGTFHAIGNRLIRQHAQRLGLDPSFSVLDRGDAADLMDVVRHRLGFSKTEKRFPRKDTCLGIYSHRLNIQLPLRHTLETAYPWCLDWEEQLTALYRAYVEETLSQQALDYDDLLLYWHVMMGDPVLAREIGAQFDQVLVDEYQDTNSTHRAA